MTVRELIGLLLDKPMDSKVYMGKGVGPLAKAETVVGESDGKFYVVLEPMRSARPAP